MKEVEAKVAHIMDAAKIIDAKQWMIASGPMFPWRVLEHASQYLKNQVNAEYDSYFAEVAR